MSVKSIEYRDIATLLGLEFNVVFLQCIAMRIGSALVNIRASGFISQVVYTPGNVSKNF